MVNFAESDYLSNGPNCLIVEGVYLSIVNPSMEESHAERGNNA